MNPVSSVSHSSLSQSDITRLPNSAIKNVATQSMASDSYEGKKSSALKKTIFAAVVLAAALVGLKHWGKNSFMKVADSNNMKFLDKIKAGANKLAGWIETPFIWVYNKVAGMIGKSKTA